jgi:hypothetical protein
VKGKSRFALLGVIVAVAAGGTAAPSLAMTSTWSKSHCSSYAKKYTHSSKSRKAAANKTLKSHGCKVKVK